MALTKDGIDELDIAKVLKNLSREIAKVENKTQAGLTLAALHIKGVAQSYTPLEFGNLRTSAYVLGPDGSNEIETNFETTKSKSGPRVAAEHSEQISLSKALMNNMTAVVGYTAYYAVYVHEIDKMYKKPKTSWKYLARALYEEQGQILKIIAKKAKK